MILMHFGEKIFSRMLATALFAVALTGTARAQVDLHVDTLECPIIGFNTGLIMPSSQLSFETLPDGSHGKNATGVL